MNRFILLASALLISISSYASSSEIGRTADNVAYQDNQVRFTVITDGVIRLEWEQDGRFTDLPSFVASERDYPEVTYKVRSAGHTPHPP